MNKPRTFSLCAPAAVVAGTVLCAMGAPNLRAADGGWTNLSGGDWSESVHWTNGVVADGAGAVTDLRLDYISPITITLDCPRTIGMIRYDDVGAVPDVEQLVIAHAENVLTVEGASGAADIIVNGTNVLILDVVLAGSRGLQVGRLTGSSGGASRIYLNKPAMLTALGLRSEGAGEVVRLSAATVGSSTGGTIKCRFAGGQTGSPLVPAGYITQLRLHGTITIEVTAVEGAVPGSVIPLIGYESLAGSPILVTGPLPAGVVGSVVDNREAGRFSWWSRRAGFLGPCGRKPSS